MQLTLRIHDGSVSDFRAIEDEILLNADETPLFHDPLEARSAGKRLSQTTSDPLYLFFNDKPDPIAVYHLGHEYVRTQYLGIHDDNMDVVATAMWQKVSSELAHCIYNSFPDARLIEMDDGDCNVFLTGDCLESMLAAEKPDDLLQVEWDDFQALVVHVLAQGAVQLVIYG